MRRVGTIVAAMAIGLTGLVGCSGGGDDKYCNTLKEQQKNSSGLEKELQSALQDPAKAKSALAKIDERFAEVIDAAPDDKIKGDWQKMQGAINTMKPLFDKLPELQKAMKDPANADPKVMKEIQAMQPKMQAMDKDIKAASSSIEKDAKTRCKIDLNKVG